MPNEDQHIRYIKAAQYQDIPLLTRIIRESFLDVAEKRTRASILKLDPVFIKERIMDPGKTYYFFRSCD